MNRCVLYFTAALACNIVLFPVVGYAQQWREIGSLPFSSYFLRSHHLSNHEILVLGGIDSTGACKKSAIVDLRDLTVTECGDLHVGRSVFASVQMPDGTVFVFGGSFDPNSELSTLVEKFNVKTKQWEDAGFITSAKTQLCAVPISDNQVLIVGGRDENAKVQNDCEVFDVLTGISTAVGEFPYQTSLGHVIRTRDGKVLAFAGRSGGPQSFRSRVVHQYNMQTRSWDACGSTDSTYFPTINQMPDGTYMWTGGSMKEGDKIDGFTNRVAVLDDCSFRSVGELFAVRTGHTAAAIDSDRLLVVGGSDNFKNSLMSCEYFSRKTMYPSEGPSLNKARTFHTMQTCRLDGVFRVMVCGGLANSGSLSSIEILDIPCESVTTDLARNGYTTIINGDAKSLPDGVLLTNSSKHQSGSVWARDRLMARDGFSTRFGFQLQNGNDNGEVDGGSPGADGIAFVLLRDSTKWVGKDGMGIGYEGLGHGLAVEFDAFYNPQQYDSSTSHIAVQVGDGTTLRASHRAPYSIALAIDGVPNFKADGTTYHGGVDYDGTRLVVLASTDSNTLKPVLSAYVDLKGLGVVGFTGLSFAGITSATGQSAQSHKLLYWTLTDCGGLVPTSVGELHISDQGNDRFWIANGHLHDKQPRGYLTVSLTSVSGELLSRNVYAPSSSMDLPDITLATGLYLVRIQEDGYPDTLLKLIITH